MSGYRPSAPSDEVRDDLQAALETGERLAASIRSTIVEAGGSIPFARFMELALYTPGLGYYSAGAVKLGHLPTDGSDFVTAPELTPLFGRTVARALAAALPPDERCITEFGGGSGALAADLLGEFDALGITLDRYRIVEVSADLRDRQRATLARRAPAALARVEWLDALPDRLEGVVVGNELLDALPVDAVIRRDGRWLERHVVIREQAFTFDERPADQALVRSLDDAVPDAASLPDGYATERHRAADAFVATVVARLSPDATAWLFDYGFPASEYFHSQRSMGTLTAHRAHRVVDDVLGAVGLQDVTAHVDFTSVARSAASAGGRVLGYTSQAAFLLNAGVLDLLGVADGSPQWARRVAAVQRLLSEAEMGELFKVIVLGKCDRSLKGFDRDRSAAL